MTLIIFVLVFAGLVIIHELGHFTAARLQGVEIEEFGIGVPPRAARLWRSKGFIVIDGKRVELLPNFDLPFNWRAGLNKAVTATVDNVDDKLVLRTIELVKTEEKQEEVQPAIVEKVATMQLDYRSGPDAPADRKKEKPPVQPGALTLNGMLTQIRTGTEYTLNWLPIGGFVLPKGEFDPTAPGGLAASSPWTRLVVLLAGPSMNLLLGVLIFSIYFAQAGVPVANKVLLSEVLPNSPAAKAGLAVGDLVMNANGEKISTIDQFREIITANLDKPIQVVYERDGQQYTTAVTPSSQRKADEGATGVILTNPIEKVSYIQALPMGFRITGAYIYELVTLPAKLIQGAVGPDQARFVGLKGIYDFMSQAVKSDEESRQAITQAPTPASAPQPTNYTLTLIGMLTLSLGVFNLMPIPALDGGRIMFLLPELIFRRRVPPKVEMTVNAVGMSLLLLLMLIVNVMDFVNPVVNVIP